MDDNQIEALRGELFAHAVETGFFVSFYCPNCKEEYWVRADDQECPECGKSINEIENSLRRKAKRSGLILKKSRSKHWSVDNMQGYLLLDAENGIVLYGNRWQLTIEDVARILDTYNRR